MNELLPDEIIAIHQALERHAVPHAFGGIPRYTNDIDVNIALPVGQHGRVLDALASLFPIPERGNVEGAIIAILT